MFGYSFEKCLENLPKVLKHWEKGIVLGHKVSKKGFEVDKAKIEVIDKILIPTTLKHIKRFLGHACWFLHVI